MSWLELHELAWVALNGFEFDHNHHHHHHDDHDLRMNLLRIHLDPVRIGQPVWRSCPSGFPNLSKFHQIRVAPWTSSPSSSSLFRIEIISFRVVSYLLPPSWVWQRCQHREEQQSRQEPPVTRQKQRNIKWDKGTRRRQDKNKGILNETKKERKETARDPQGN